MFCMATCSLCGACKSLARLHVEVSAIAHRARPSAPLACILNPGDDEDVMTTVECVLGK